MKPPAGSSTLDASTRAARVGRSREAFHLVLRKTGRRRWLALTALSFALCVPAAALLILIGVRLHAEYAEQRANQGPETAAFAETIRQAIAKRMGEVEDQLVSQFPDFAPQRLVLDPGSRTARFVEGGSGAWSPTAPVLRQVLQFGRSPWREPVAEGAPLVYSAPGAPGESWSWMMDELLALDFGEQTAAFSPFVERPIPLTDLLGLFHDRPADQDELLEQLRQPELYEAVEGAATRAILGQVLWNWRPEGGPVLVYRRIHVPDLWESDRVLASSRIGTTLSGAFWIIHGFELDRDWVFDDLILGTATPLLRPGDAVLRGVDPSEATNEVAESIGLAARFGVRGDSPQAETVDFSLVADPDALRRRFRRSFLQLISVGTVLLGMLGSGVYLLASSLSRELRRTRRMEAFTAAVSHELRTPIATIGVHLDLLRQDDLEEAERDLYYERIEGEAFRLTQLVDGILERAKLTGGLAAPAAGDSVPLELSETIARMRAGLTSLTGERIEFDLGADLPLVSASTSAIESIVTNLVENATKYGLPEQESATSPPIRLTTREADGRVVLEVADRGPGIPPEHRAACFEPFVRFHDESSGGPPGTGLGLHLVALQAAALQATIRVDDRPGGGAVVQVSFPPA